MGRLFLQLTVIVVACNIAGWIGRRFLLQSTVFMEMLAGFLLGPSFFGLFFPDLSQQVFPKALALPGIESPVTHPNMHILYGLAQVGLVLYMFVVGTEVSHNELLKQAKTSVRISFAGILTPLAISFPLAYFLLHHSDLFVANISYVGAFLVVACSFSVTAFPMLARMLSESGLSNTKLGTTVLSAAAIDDLLAWLLFPIAVSASVASAGTALTKILFVVGYVFLLSFVLNKYSRRINSVILSGFTPLVLVVLFLSAFTTDVLGISSVFGAFACGAAFPRIPILSEVTSRFKSVALSIFLPCFFVYTGLNTKITLVNTPLLAIFALVICIIAILSKFLPCFLASRSTGMSVKDSLVTGALMNSRGLMELILLNVFLDKSIISPTFYTIMVLMTIVTTSLASPVYNSLLPGKSDLERIII